MQKVVLKNMEVEPILALPEGLEIRDIERVVDVLTILAVSTQPPLPTLWSKSSESS